MKIIFAGTPDIAAAVLETLLQAKHNIIACLTQPDRPQGRGLKLTPSPVKQIALQHDIKILQPETLKDPAVQQQLTTLQPDLMIVLAYGLILPQVVLDIPRHGCINIHASILPRWRGAAPIQHAILSGDQATGITIMQMDAGLDSGDMLAIYSCEIGDHDTSADLLQRLTTLAQSSIIDVLPKLAAGALPPIPQDATQATFAPKILKAQAKINWHASAANIDRCIRAYNPWPVAFTDFFAQTIRIWESEIAAQSSDAIPGAIINCDNGIEVATGVGILRILSLQFPGKKALPIKEVCHAHPELRTGAMFK